MESLADVQLALQEHSGSLCSGFSFHQSPSHTGDTTLQLPTTYGRVRGVFSRNRHMYSPLGQRDDVESVQGADDLSSAHRSTDVRSSRFLLHGVAASEIDTTPRTPTLTTPEQQAMQPLHPRLTTLQRQLSSPDLHTDMELVAGVHARLQRLADETSDAQSEYSDDDKRFIHREATRIRIIHRHLQQHQAIQTRSPVATASIGSSS